MLGLLSLFSCLEFLNAFATWKVAGRSLGELVKKLGERVLPSIIPILSRGLKDPSTSRRQVRFLLPPFD